MSERELPYCDLVMKGGITSGIVYPRAVTRLSERYRFKNIGGASAGAIAAAMAAAAEYGREDGGFQRLETAAADVGTRLLDLFKPLPRTKPVFDALMTAMASDSVGAKIFKGLGVLANGYPKHTIVGGLAGAVLFLAWMANDRPTVYAIVALMILVLGVLVGLTMRLMEVFRVDLPAQGFGLCSGLTPREGGKGPAHAVDPTKPSHDPADPALTEWLSDQLDIVSGRMQPGGRYPDHPLTFGDLRGDDPENPRINLEVVTTCLSAGRPYRIPFDTRIFLFREDEMAALFPPRVVDWMVRRSNEYENDPRYRFLPANDDLPVIVAVRMSLSFPLLISAVPLHARDFNLLDANEREKPRAAWFSDGGICSNFPIHFFDSIWPRWPTFGITLETFRFDRHVEGEDEVWAPTAAGQGITPDFTPIRSVGGFFQSILSTMQGWQDTMQSLLPGYRERIVHIRLKDYEGGLNLGMDQATIDTLVQRGVGAGERLRDEFDFEGHRWRRFVVSMARFEETLETLDRAYNGAPPQGESLHDFLERYPDEAAEYKQTKTWNDAARAAAEDLQAGARAWGERPPLREGRIPKPDTDLRVTPRI